MKEKPIAWSIALTMLVLAAPPAHADGKADRAAVSDTLAKLSTSAAALAQTAKESDDRSARKKFSPAATDLSDDLAALARRVGKDTPVKSLLADAAAVDKAATALVDLADEIEDKDDRKDLRARAALIQQATATARKVLEALKDGDGAPAAPTRFTGRVFNDTNADACSWPENLKFVISRDGQQVFTSQNMIFPGKDVAVVLDKGRYLVQMLDTSGTLLGQGNLDAGKEGWSFRSGCVKD